MNELTTPQQDTDPRPPSLKGQEVFLNTVYRFLIRYGNSIFALATTFLLGRLSDGLANPQVKTLSDFLHDVFDVAGRPINWANWIVLVIMIITPILVRIARRWRKKQSYESILASTLQRLKDRSLSRFNVIAIGKSITLQKCPEMERGWLPSEVEIDHRSVRFRLPDDLARAYRDYFKMSFIEEHGEDGTTVMLVERPVAWTDRPRLAIKTQLNLYSYSQFYWHRVILDPDRYNQMINALYERGSISFPHNLCMHLVVMTKDNKALLTLRSTKVGSDPGSWSCSIEENLRSEDLRGDRRKTFVRWMHRAIFEELGVAEHCYTEHNLKVLSVFLEANRLNISIAGLVTLDLDHEELSEIIAALPRSDYEFTEYDYLGLQEMAREMVNPTRNYHPTSRYRMLMTLLHRYGEPNFARRLIGLLNSTSV